MRANRSGKNMQMIFTLLLFVLFVFLLFIILIYSAGFYKRIGESTEMLSNKSSAMLFIAQKIHSSDNTGGVAIEEKSGSRMLCFNETADGGEYCTYVYCKDGYLYELFTEKSGEPNLSYGNIITPLDRLDIVSLSDSIIELTFVYGDDITKKRIFVHCGITAESQVT